MIEAVNIQKNFVRSRKWFRKSTGASVVEAVKCLSFEIQPGEFVGFLGPNGAGKSTTIKMMTGILHPSAGRVSVAGLSPQRNRTELAKQIGIVFGQRTQLWWDLPLSESFRILQAMYSVPKAEHRQRLLQLTELLDLDAFCGTPVRQLSLGQRMRGELAAALLHRPKVVFLDEPTIGLDITAKLAVRRFLKTLNREYDATIILTTHDMADVEELCDRIIVINQGEKVFDGGLDRLHEQVGIPSALSVRFRTSPNLVHIAENPQLQVTLIDDDVTAFVQFNRARISAVETMEWLRRAGDIVDFSMQEPRLETIIQEIYAGR